MKKKIKILAVCYANYCRSPVVENLLSNFLSEDYDVDSAGLQPMTEARMDERSRNYLEKIEIKNIIHNPKKLTIELIKSNTIILALDLIILNELNKLFPAYKHKFFMINRHMTSKKIIGDPYKFDEKRYHDAMDELAYICKELTDKSINKFYLNKESS